MTSPHDYIEFICQSQTDLQRQARWDAEWAGQAIEWPGAIADVRRHGATIQVCVSVQSGIYDEPLGLVMDFPLSEEGTLVTLNKGSLVTVRGALSGDMAPSVRDRSVRVTEPQISHRAPPAAAAGSGCLGAALALILLPCIGAIAMVAYGI